MGRVAILCLVASLAIASPASALHLIWSSGNRDLATTGAVRCTLLVSPSGNESLLPGSWRLVYVGDSQRKTGALAVLKASGPGAAAAVYSVTPPQTDAEILSRQTTVEFAGPGDGQTTPLAAYVMWVDPTLRARIAAIPASDMLEPAGGTIDSTSEVTINGGTDLGYPACVWAATAIAGAGGTTNVALTGVGMDQVQSVVLHSGSAATFGSRDRALESAETAIDDTLDILEQNANYIVGHPHSPVSGGQLVVLGNGAGDANAASNLIESSPQNTASGPIMSPGGNYRTKDFTFIFALGQFHIFYIRHDDTLPPSQTELEFGHAVSSNLFSWQQLPTVLAVRPDKWDNAHVWAPSIIEDHGVFYMFYTGVTRIVSQGLEYQQTGLATSTDLMNWTRYDAPVFGGVNSAWAYADTTHFEGCQFRDPFVITDPATPGSWLMYHVGTPKVQHSQVIVGVAQNAGTTSTWNDVKPFWNTDAIRSLGQCESPHVFQKSGLWYLFLTSNSGHPLQVEYANSPVADSAGWAGSWSLYRVLGNDATTDNWYASEYLSVAGHDYFAFVNFPARGIEIREMAWGAPPTGGAMPLFTLGNPNVAAVDPGGLLAPAERMSMAVLGRGSSGSRVALRIGMPVAADARVDLFDVLGRRVRTLRAGRFPAGISTVAWDGSDAGGVPSGSGIYFARLTAGRDARVAKVLLIH